VSDISTPTSGVFFKGLNLLGRLVLKDENRSDGTAGNYPVQRSHTGKLQPLRNFKEINIIFHAYSKYLEAKKKVFLRLINNSVH